MVKNVVHGDHAGHLTIIIHNNETDGFVSGFSHLAVEDQVDGLPNICFLIDRIKRRNHNVFGRQHADLPPYPIAVIGKHALPATKTG